MSRVILEHSEATIIIVFTAVACSIFHSCKSDGLNSHARERFRGEMSVGLQLILKLLLMKLLSGSSLDIPLHGGIACIHTSRASYPVAEFALSF